MRLTDSNCVFCKIVAGAIPSYKLTENEHVLAFLDIGPISPGHCLVIPKGHWVTLDAMPDEVAAACGQVMPTLGKAAMKAVNAKAFNVLQNNGPGSGQAVNHVHFHIIPVVDDSKLHFVWTPGELSKADAVALREAMVNALGQ